MLSILFSNSVAMRTPAVRMSGAAPYPYNFITIHPTYTINDPEAVTTIMEEYVTSSKAESGLCYSGFSTTRSKPDSSVVGDYAVAPGDKLFVREAYPDAPAALAHLKNVAPLRTKLVDGPATLSELQLHGPAAALEACRGAVEAIAPEASFYEIASGMSRLEKEAGGMPLPLVLVSLHSTFRVKDATKAAALCEEVVARANSEENCLCAPAPPAHAPRQRSQRGAASEPAPAARGSLRLDKVWRPAGVPRGVRQRAGAGAARRDRARLHGRADGGAGDAGGASGVDKRPRPAARGTACEKRLALGGPRGVCGASWGSSGGGLAHLSAQEASQLHATVDQMAVVNEFVGDMGRARGYCSAETERFVASAGYSRFEVQQSMFGFFFRR